MKSRVRKAIDGALSKSQLNPRQAQFMRLYADPGSITFGNAYASGVAAGYSDSYSHVVNNRLGEVLADNFLELLESAGVTDKRMAERIGHLLEGHDGRDIAKALEFGLRLRGHLKPNAAQSLTINLLDLGVKDEADGRRLIDLGRAMEEVSPAEELRAATEVVRGYVDSHPDDAERVRKELGL